ncbi:MAG: spoVB [Oscillospiraceae bacterium]|jgi:stage V sporulation protein B|nr:spoVB [Oscillospiraceae bacterium]
MNLKKQGFLYGSAILAASVIISKIIGALFKIPLANVLGGTGMGYFSCAYGLFLPVYAVSTTGLPAAVAKLVAENSAFGRYLNIKKIKRVSILVFSLSGLAASLLMAVFALPFCKHIAKTPEALPAVLMIAPSIFFGSVMSVYRGYYEGLKNMYPTALSQVAESFAKLAAGLGFALLVLEYAHENPEAFMRFAGFFTDVKNSSPENLALAYSAAAAVLGVTAGSALGMVFLILRHKIFGDGIGKKEILQNKTIQSSKEIAIGLAKTIIPMSIGSLAANITSLIDLGTITRMLESQNAYLFFKDINIPKEELPNFIYGSFTGLALTVFNLVPSLAGIFGKGIFPTLAESWAAKNQKRIQKSVESVIFASSLIAVPSGIGICALSKEILMFLYSGREAEIAVSFEALAILGIGSIFLSLSIPVFSMLQAIGYADLPVKIMLIGAAAKLIGNIAFMSIPEININGAALSTVICYILTSYASIKLLCKKTKTSLNRNKLFFKPFLGGIFCAISAVLANLFLAEIVGERLSLLISILLGGIIYILVLFFTGGITKNEIKSLF